MSGITVKVHAPVGTIILDRPEKSNALSMSAIGELRQALDDLRQEKKVRGVVISAAGNNFCAGLDLEELNSVKSQPNAIELWHEHAQVLSGCIGDIMMHPKPVICCVDGKALGFGLAMALASDLLIASDRASFASSDGKWGLVSGLVAPLAQFRAGASLAGRLTIGGEELSAHALKELGVIHHMVPQDQIWVRASSWIGRLSESAYESLQLSKRVLNEMVGESLMTALSSGAAATATSLTTEAAHEGLAAFSEKRVPQFPQ